jgi:hypothetical protein
MTSYVDVFGGQVINPAQVSYIAITLNANKTLSWSTEFQDENPVVAYQMDISPTSGGFSLTLPDATQTSVGQAILINNPTAFSFTLKKNDGATLATISATTINYFYLIDNSTDAGTWRQTPFGGGYTAVTSINASVPTSPSSNNLAVTGGPITTTGTFSFVFDGDLLALIDFASNVGIPARTAAETWSLRTLTGTANQIQITNGTGVAGDPTFALASTISGINSLTAGNIQISGNTIASTNSNGSIILLTNGSGDIHLHPDTSGKVLLFEDILTEAGIGIQFNSADSSDGYFKVAAGSMGTTTVDMVWPTNAPAAGQVLRAGTTPTQFEWASAPTVPSITTANAITKYVNTGGGLGEAGVFIDSLNNVTGMTSLICGNITIGLSTTNTITSNNTNGNITFAPNGSGRVQFNCSGEILASNVLRFNNAGNTNYNYLGAASALATTIGWTLPLAQATLNNAFLVSDTGGQLSFSTLSTNNVPKVYGKVNSSGTALSISGATVSLTTNPGVYTIVFTSPFATANYTVLVTLDGATGTYISNSASTTDVEIKTFAVDGSTATNKAFSFAIIGT